MASHSIVDLFAQPGFQSLPAVAEGAWPAH